MRFETDHSRLVRDVMTPMPLVTAPGRRRRRTTRWRCCAQHKIEKLPLVDAERPAARADHGQGLRQARPVPAAPPRTPTAGWSSAPPSASARTPTSARQALVDAGVDVLVVDTAHGHSARRPRDGRPAQGATPTRRRRRRQHRHPRRRPGAGRRGRRRGEGRRRPGLDLHHPRGGRRRRAAGHARSTRRRWPAARPVCR